jgi:hypothetical protein
MMSFSDFGSKMDTLFSKMPKREIYDYLTACGFPMDTWENFKRDADIPFQDESGYP